MSSFGEELRRERELRNVSLQEIAEATKVRVRFLEALEKNEFDALPGGLFTRGFIRAYSHHLGLDPDRMITAFLYQLTEDREKEGQDAKRPARLEHTGDVPARPWIRRLPWLTAAVAAVGLLSFMGYRWLAGAEAPATSETRILTARPRVNDAPSTMADHHLRILALESERIRVTCAGQELMDRALQAGESVELRCGGSFGIHTEGSGGLRVELDEVDLATPPGPLRGWEPTPPGDLP